MGTTATTLAAGSLEDGWVLAIEGYPKLIIARNDTASAVTAWSGTDWSSAITGLMVDAEIESRIEPWTAKLHVPVRKFKVMQLPDDDSFGTAVFATGAGNETRLAADFDADDTTMTVKSTADFTATGTVYLGCEAITYTGKTATTFTGCSRGKYSPFQTSAGANLGRDATLPSSDWDTHYLPIVSDQPRTWEGRMVGLWLHRVVPDATGAGSHTWDVKAQAELVFAGIITGTADVGGHTELTCHDIRLRLRETVLLHDQFRGRVQEGMNIPEGWTFKIKESDAGASSKESTLTFKDSPSGVTEAQSGQYHADELIRVLNDFVQEANAATTVSGDWRITLRSSDNGSRTVVTQSGMTGSTSAQSYIEIRGSYDLLPFLGFEGNKESDTQFSTGPVFQIVSTFAPVRRWGTEVAALNGDEAGALFLEATRGTWWNNQTWLPPKLKAQTTTGGDWGVLAVGDILYLAKRVSDTEFNNLIYDITNMTRPDDVEAQTIRWDDDAGVLHVKQVAIIHGSLVDVLTRLLASTGGSGSPNHATYDDYPAQLGAAIPWDLLGNNFVNTLTALEGSSNRDTVTLMIESPRKLEEQVGGELLFRGAWLIFADGGLQFVQHPTASSGASVHTLTEDEKALQSGAQSSHRSTVRTESAWIRNVIKIEFNRDIAGKYHSTLTYKDHDSIQSYGQREQVIKARNSFGEFFGLDSDAEDLFIDLVTEVQPLWARPLRVIERTVNQTFYLAINPGDVCIVSDNLVRDPETGARGITQKPAVVLSKQVDFGAKDKSQFGKVTLAFAPLDTAGPYCPSATIDATSYLADTPTAGQSTITCDAHSFSESADAADASHFEASDGVRVFSRDQTTPSDEWEAAVISVSGNDIVLDQNLTGFDTSGATYYAITFQDYNGADIQTSQQGHVFTADDADGQINNARNAFTWGGSVLSSGAFTTATQTNLPERIRTDIDDELSPVATYAHFAAYQMAINLVQYKTAPSQPHMEQTSNVLSETGTSYKLRQIYSFMVGPMQDTGGTPAKLSIAPMFKSGSGGTASVRVSLAPLPASYSSHTAITLPTPSISAEFTTTSTSYVVATAQTLTPNQPATTGLLWVFVELKAASTDSCDFLGLAECRLTANG